MTGKRQREYAKKMTEKLKELSILIFEYAQASRADEMRGGGDPNDSEVIAANCKLAEAKVLQKLGEFQREFEE